MKEMLFLEETEHEQLKFETIFVLFSVKTLNCELQYLITTRRMPSLFNNYPRIIVY